MKPLNWLSQFSISPNAASRYQGVLNGLRLFRGYSPFPLNIDLVLTLRCNLACDFCVCAQEENVGNFSAFRDQELSLEEWKHVVEDIRNSFLVRPNLNLLGGEPSVYAGYVDLIAFIKKQGFRSSLTTNGVLLLRDAERLVAAGVDMIPVSLDGPRDTHDSSRGAGVYDRVVKGIQRINEVKAAQEKEAPRLSLTCAITGDNHGHLVSLIDVAKQLDIAYINFLHLQFPDSEIDTHGINVDLLLQQMEKTRNRAQENDVSLNFYPHLRTEQVRTYYMQSSEQLGKGCVSPWIRMVIMPDGEVVPCRGYVVGNAAGVETTMGKMWNNDRFRAFRRTLAHNGLFPDCGRCCRKQY